jgi:hypothetical protein
MLYGSSIATAVPMHVLTAVEVKSQSHDISRRSDHAAAIAWPYVGAPRSAARDASTVGRYQTRLRSHCWLMTGP